jgi:guanine deaminase
VHEAAIIAAIAQEYAELKERFDHAETTLAPMLAAMEQVYRRSLAVGIAPDTFQARMG